MLSSSCASTRSAANMARPDLIRLDSGFFRVSGTFKGNIGAIYMDDGKENGNYYNILGYMLGFYWDGFGFAAV